MKKYTIDFTDKQSNMIIGCRNCTFETKSIELGFGTALTEAICPKCSTKNLGEYSTVSI